MSNITIEKQEIVQGSSHIVNSNLDKKFDKIEYMKKNMEYNLAYTYYIQRLKTKDLDKKILKNFINRYEANCLIILRLFILVFTRSLDPTTQSQLCLSSVLIISSIYFGSCCKSPSMTTIFLKEAF